MPEWVKEFLYLPDVTHHQRVCGKIQELPREFKYVDKSSAMTPFASTPLGVYYEATAKTVIKLSATARTPDATFTSSADPAKRVADVDVAAIDVVGCFVMSTCCVERTPLSTSATHNVAQSRLVI